VETIKHQKEKELDLQKDEVEFLVSGIRHAVLFSEALVKEGSDLEVVASHQQVITRVTTLSREREQASLEPVTDADIEFVGREEGEDLLSSVIKELGTVLAKDFSLEQSTIETPTRTIHQIHEVYSFKVIFVDKKGNKLSSAMKGLVVEVAGPSAVKGCFTSHSFLSMSCPP